jgi:hypothetical protein
MSRILTSGAGPAGTPAGAVRPLVVAVCTCRLDDLSARWKQTMDVLRDEELFVVLDVPASPQVAALADRIRAHGGTVAVVGETQGLSAARNLVLDCRPDHHVLFIDDDALLSREALVELRRALADGAHVVGARLVPPDALRRLPWYLTPGQVHLVGWHASADTVKVWGACMGIDARFAHRNGLRFDARLGRTGRRLESGDDTSFVAAMKDCGAQETLLPAIHVVHQVSPARLRLRYLIRRVYWQGRSEVRRGQPLAGLRKEWQRHRRLSRPALVLPLATLYLTAFLAGVVVEAARSVVRLSAADPGTHAAPRSRRRNPGSG